MRPLLSGLISLLTLSSFAGRPSIYSGPMQGHTTDSTMSLWLMVDKRETNSYTLLENNIPVQTFHDSLVKLKQNCWRGFCPVTLNYSGLAPRKEYSLQIESSKGKITIPRSYNTTSAIDAAMPAEFSVLAGSCFMRGTGGLTDMVDNPLADPIYKVMKNDSSELMLWLGDNLYYLFEYISARGMLRKNVETRLLPEIQQLISSKIHYAIWDDHEFGPNNSDGAFKRKNASTRIFNAFWPNPVSSKTGKSNYYTFKYCDAEFFMLDDRYHSERVEGKHSIIDSAQIEWLKQSLLSSEATFKLLCLGGQWFNDKRQNSVDIFQGSREFEGFMRFLDSAMIEGLVLLSGDIHYSMLQKVPRKNAYPLYELSTSAVSSHPNDGPLKWPGSVSSHIVPGTLYTGNNYARLSFSGEAGNRTLMIRCFNVKGVEVWNQRISEKELK